jgi:ADP-heptose:LPS heptosyltransferase
MRDRHRWMAGAAVGLQPLPNDAQPLFWIGEADRAAATALLWTSGVADTRSLVAMAAGARSHLKRWREEAFAAVADGLTGDGCAVVLVGDESDRSPAEQIRQRCGASAPVNLCGRTSLRQLGALLQRCRLLISNDSAPVHLAGLLSVPVLAIFGPTDSRKYGPVGAGDRVARVELFCSPCERAQCRYDHECMRWLPADRVLTIAREMLSVGKRRSAFSDQPSAIGPKPCASS